MTKTNAQLAMAPMPLAHCQLPEHFGPAGAAVADALQQPDLVHEHLDSVGLIHFGDR